MKIKKFGEIYESLDDTEKEIINDQIDFACVVLKKMMLKFKDRDITTEDFNEIIDKKIKELKKDKFEIW